MESELKGIVVEFGDGTTKRIETGCCVDLNGSGKGMSIEMLMVKPLDFVRLAYGILVTVDKMGLTEVLQAYADGSILPGKKKKEGTDGEGI